MRRAHWRNEIDAHGPQHEVRSAAVNKFDFQCAVNVILRGRRAERMGEHGGLLSTAELDSLYPAIDAGQTPEQFAATIERDRETARHARIIEESVA